MDNISDGSCSLAQWGSSAAVSQGLQVQALTREGVQFAGIRGYTALAQHAEGMLPGSTEVSDTLKVKNLHLSRDSAGCTGDCSAADTMLCFRSHCSAALPSCVHQTMQVAQLVHAFRARGHLMAQLDPLQRPADGPWQSEAVAGGVGLPAAVGAQAW